MRYMELSNRSITWKNFGCMMLILRIRERTLDGWMLTSLGFSGQRWRTASTGGASASIPQFSCWLDRTTACDVRKPPSEGTRGKGSLFFSLAFFLTTWSVSVRSGKKNSKSIWRSAAFLWIWHMLEPYKWKNKLNKSKSRNGFIMRSNVRKCAFCGVTIHDASTEVCC